MNRKVELNREYNTARFAIREIINKIDPIDLFPGSPEDEYDPEVNDILAQLAGAKNETESLQMVKKVFDKWFGEKIEEKKLTTVGADLMKIKSQFSWLNFE